MAIPYVRLVDSPQVSFSSYIDEQITTLQSRKLTSEARWDAIAKLILASGQELKTAESALLEKTLSYELLSKRIFSDPTTTEDDIHAFQMVASTLNKSMSLKVAKTVQDFLEPAVRDLLAIVNRLPECTPKVAQLLSLLANGALPADLEQSCKELVTSYKSTLGNRSQHFAQLDASIQGPSQHKMKKRSSLSKFFCCCSAE